MMEDYPFPQISRVNVMVEKVASLLTNLKPHKAPGPDNIPAFFSKKQQMRLPYFQHTYISPLWTKAYSQ